jgi:hypothetical protein
VRRERAQHEDAADLGIRVDLGDLADDLAEGGVGGRSGRDTIPASRARRSMRRW